MMKVIGLKTKGGPIDQLEELEIPIPELRPKDVLVKVQAVGMNPVDTKKRKGDAELEKPLILGYDGVGIVEKLGSEASLFEIGDKVWLAGVINRNGTNAEYIAVDERIVGNAPQKISTAQAAAVPLVLLTAWEGLFEQLGLKAFDPANQGKTLLILPGAGGVGSFVVQLAKKLCGLTVVATASRPESEAAAKALGADHVINHRMPLKQQLELKGLSGVDYIFNAYDTHANFDQY
jgi:zinc-binding alcohol dehydrogenase family protein